MAQYFCCESKKIENDDINSIEYIIDFSVKEIICILRHILYTNFGYCLL